MFIYNQVTLSAGETLVAKQSSESFLKLFGFAVSNYHGDYGVSNSQAFRKDCHFKQQQITFSGFGAHHKIAVTEHSIQTVIGWARTQLLHDAIHWPEMANLNLWPFALQHAVYLWNILPDQQSPLELIYPVLALQTILTFNAYMFGVVLPLS